MSRKERFPKLQNTYHVTSLCFCLRKAYYEFHYDKYEKLDPLFSKNRGSTHHNITYAYKWRELDVSSYFEIDNEKVKIVGHIDSLHIAHIN